jgi:hypothetical protein
MYIHIGSRIVVSDKKVVGVFNIATMKKSAENGFFLLNTIPRDKSIIVGRDNSILSSIVSPYTIIKRAQENEIRPEMK